MALTKVTGDMLGSSVSFGLKSVQTFTASGTWTKPAGVTKVIVEVQGAGGSGSGHGASSTQARAGGAGGYAKKLIDVSGVSTSTITVGTGGTGVGGTSANVGNAGGASSWNDGTTTVTGNGGSGGSNTSYALGGAGGTATGGDVNITGERGGLHSNNVHYPGGKSVLGFGGWGKTINYHETSDPPVGYGSGSGGSFNVTSTEDAADGIVIVWEYA